MSGHSKVWRLRLWWLAFRSLLSESYRQEDMKRFEDSLEGVWPEANLPGDLILVACDDVYFRKFGLGFLKSVETVSEPHVVHVHLLKPSEETVSDVERIRKNSGHLQLSYTVDPCVFAQRLNSPRFYINAARFILAPLLLRRGVKRLLITDVDVLMNRSPWPQIDQLDDQVEVALIQRPEKRNAHYKILASAVFLRLGAEGQRFSSAFARSILAALGSQPSEHVDQILPYYLLGVSKARSGRWFAQMPESIMNYQFEPTASFWTAKGANKHAEEFTHRFAVSTQAN